MHITEVELLSIDIMCAVDVHCDRYLACRRARMRWTCSAA
jgi:hypothetical protein